MMRLINRIRAMYRETVAISFILRYTHSSLFTIDPTDPWHPWRARDRAEMSNG